jgi:NarL family two-component system response regulator LiaR
MRDQQRITVLIVDDHRLLREGVRTYLELHDDIEVVGEAGDGAAAVELVARLHPDVVLMDLVMPGLDGVTATRRVVELGTGAKVIVLTSFAGDDQVFPAIQAGATSYLLKDVSPEEMVASIRATHRGEPRLHPDVARKLMAAMRDTPADTGAKGSEKMDELTEREREVVRLVAQGRSNHDIAAEFVISEKTVKAHVSHALTKLGLNDRTQLAIYAIKHGFVDS